MPKAAEHKIVLIADDDAAHRRMLGAALESVGYRCRGAVDGATAVEDVRAASPDLVLLDLRMPRLDGVGALRQIAEMRPELPVVIITAHGDVKSAVETMKLGARDFIEKPVDIDELRSVVADILERPQPANVVDGASLTADGEPRTIIGVSVAIEGVRETIRLAAGAESIVLVRGESGTGKELVARAVHDLSPRRCEGPFVALNCAAVAEGLLESELFGHERGAFTGAGSRRIGRFEQASGGTLFLDEIGELQPHLQAKLLRVLQERSFERVGGGQPVEVDIRVVAATNRDLGIEIGEGRFREDLYYRLAVVEIELPPLRSRREDILPTARHLLRQLTSDRKQRLSADVASALALYDWPGNVRELSNILERSLLFSASGEMQLRHLPPNLQKMVEGDSSHASEEEPGTGVRPGIALQRVEQDLIEKTLAALGGNRTLTAEVLGLSRRALLYKLKRYGIQ